MEQNKVEILEALNNEKMYSLRGDEVGEMCSPEGDDTCGDCVLIITEIGGFTGFYEWSSVYLPPICHRNFKNYH